MAVILREQPTELADLRKVSQSVGWEAAAFSCCEMFSIIASPSAEVWLQPCVSCCSGSLREHILTQPVPCEEKALIDREEEGLHGFFLEPFFGRRPGGEVERVTAEC